ncbi:hypothetical protein F4808DRAFT_448286 [Astrocystis sublimbata]|nr:hypothetical protein F4808DRAFT_448286 [Astrocystis sublimbata]
MDKKKLHWTDYDMAWICPVATVELLPSRLMLDEEHNNPVYDTGYDNNVYIFGAMAGHNLVIATCPKGMTGNVNAGRLAGPLFKSFPSIRMALLVGVSGGIPQRVPSTLSVDDVHVGDIVVGAPRDRKPAYIYYKSGRTYANGSFELLGTIDRPDCILLNALERLQSDYKSRHGPKFAFPSLVHDRLFRVDYQHVGSYNSAYYEYNRIQLVNRPARAKEDTLNLLFYHGRIATGNSVIQDGKKRDRIRDQYDGVLYIEMEAAGIDMNRPCLVVQGTSDYADLHKDNVWRSYAAANAAVFARELLCKVPPSTMRHRLIDTNVQDRYFLVPFGRNENFVGRDTILERLLEKIPPGISRDDCQRAALEGLGGIGKTQIALEAAYRIRDKYPDCSNAYREIGRLLQLPGIDDDKADVNTLIKRGLSQESAGSWLLHSSQCLVDFLPFSLEGSILFTTRNHEIASSLGISDEQVIPIPKMDDAEVTTLLRKGLRDSQVANTKTTKRLLRFLTNLPLAIKQALAYISKKRMVTMLDYLESYGSTAVYLKFMCFLAEKDIPLSLPPPAPKIEMKEAISTLQAYAFITERNSSGTFDIHRLVRLILRNWLQEKGEWVQWTTKVVQQLGEVYPFPKHENRKTWIKYLSHRQTVLEIDGAIQTNGEIDLPFNVAQSYLYREAERLYQQTLGLREKVLGREHSDTLSSMNNLALVLYRQGKYEEAEEILLRNRAR